VTAGETVALSGEILIIGPGQTNPAPEPATCALFIAGLAGVGSMARRRRKT